MQSRYFCFGDGTKLASQLFVQPSFVLAGNAFYR